MATTNLMPLHVGKGRDAQQAIRSIIGYVNNPDKTQNGELVTGYACAPQTFEGQFLLARREYLQTTGRTPKKSDVIAYHLRQSFAPGEITPEEANRIGQELAEQFTNGNHAFIVATHTDKKHVHNHIIWNAITLDCDRKFRNFWGSSKKVRELSDALCQQNGLSIVENPKAHGATYNKWLGDRKQPAHRDILRMAIDTALEKKPDSFDTLLQLLQEAGWEIKRGKQISLKLAEHQRSMRLDSLGDSYTEEMLRAVLAGEKAHMPQRPKAKSTTKQNKISQLVDIQEKLQQGKGTGYERWAKVFNLKQMAQTVNYLTEHGLLEYELLTKKVNEVVAQHAELSAKIKGAEKHMSEIADLKKQIINYSKTRDVYEAYRKSGYSKKFLAEHEQDIQIHKAAKRAFEELGRTKLPTIKSLQTEYDALLAEKQAAYADYRKAKEEMRELLTIKANVDKLLKQTQENEQVNTRENDQEYS